MKTTVRELNISSSSTEEKIWLLNNRQKNDFVIVVALTPCRVSASLEQITFTNEAQRFPLLHLIQYNKRQKKTTH